MEKHAVYLTVKLAAVAHDGRPREDHVTFRIGQPVSLDAAHKRHQRLQDRAVLRKLAHRIRHARRWYTTAASDWYWFEVRAVDKHGRGLGSERHATAIPVPYRAIRIAR